MRKNSNSLIKNNIHFKHKPLYVNLFVVFLFLFSIICIVGFNSDISVMAGSSYMPAAPAGETEGIVDTNYEYLIYTMDVGSSWMFDWGDGSYSDWIIVGESVTSIVQEHNWDSSGVYEVRVRHKSIYQDDSDWSPSLVVSIDISTDLDGDGYSNVIEEAYGTDAEDPTGFPADFDKDGIPDDDSPGGGYTGDSDDDGDGLTDQVEESLGSNAEDESDVTSIIIDGITHYFVDINEDGKLDTFYNSQKQIHTKLKTENSEMLIDFDGDNEIEYSYSPVNGIASYETPFEIPWMYVILAIVLIILFVIFILFKTGFISVYEEEYVLEE